MTLSRRVFEISWRLAILALPWQTRWFADASLAGWPWEQGRLSVYLSWIPMIVAIALSLRRRVEGRRSNPSKIWVWVFLWALIFISMVTVLRDAFRDFASLRPILQWWAQIGMLGLCVYALRRSSISTRSIATWVVVSLIPHALLGVWQFASQQVIASTWLGIASQLPQTPGVSVVAHDGLRILRAYGGFPHPNIFGGWLAVGAIVAIGLAAASQKRRDVFLWIAASSALASVLVLTFARGAWLALFVGIGVWLALERKHWRIMCIPLIVFAITILLQREQVFARFDLTQRLEQKSVDQRVGSLRGGIDLFRGNPLIGNGVNAELLEAAGVGRWDGYRSDAPLEPPHNAFLLALVDVGLIGFMALIGLAIIFFRRSRWSPTARGLMAGLWTMAFFDHYLWSMWSGHALVALVILSIVEPKTDP